MSRLVKIKLALIDKDHLIATDYVADASGQWEETLDSLTAMSRNVRLDRTFERGGFTVGIADGDGIYKAMMTNDSYRKIKDAIVTVYIYKTDGVTLSRTISASVFSWDRKDDIFYIKCVQEFDGKMNVLPSDLIISATDWPNAASQALNKAVVYPSGVLYKKGGAINAWRIDAKPNAKYLLTWSDPALAARILSIQGVFQYRRLIKNTTAYTLVRDASGWEYLALNWKYKNTKLLTVNLTAAASAASAGNPVAYMREVLLGLGITLMDDGEGGTADFEGFCDTNLWGIINTLEADTVQEFIEIWCNNFDCFWIRDAAGIVHIKHINWATITADAILTDQHFIDFVETSEMSNFANKIRAKLSYNNANSEWTAETVTNSTTADYSPVTKPIEKKEEYAIATFGGAVTPMISKLRYLDHPEQTINASIDIDLYEALTLDLLKVIDATHFNQIGGSGKYLIISENCDALAGTVSITGFKLWGI